MSFIRRLKNYARYGRDEIKSFYANLKPDRFKRFDFGSLDGDRLIIIAHFDIHRIFDPVFLFLVEKLKEQLSAKVMVVSTNEHMTEENIKLISSKVECFILRNNFGQDFGSWKLGLSLVPDYQKYKSIVFANDTVYGPFQSVEPFVTKIESMPNAVIGGLTDNLRPAHHLQSYFLIFNNACLKTQSFQKFWTNFKKKYGRTQNIRNGEIGLSVFARKNEIELIPCFPYTEIKKFVLENRRPLETWRKILENQDVNSYHFFWRELIENFGYPFIKMELLKFNPSKIGNIEDYPQIVKKISSYPIVNIENHVRRAQKHRDASK